MNGNQSSVTGVLVEPLLPPALPFGRERKPYKKRKNNVTALSQGLTMNIKHLTSHTQQRRLDSSALNAVRWNINFRCGCLAILLALGPVIATAQEKQAELVPETEIVALQEDLAQGARGASLVDVRRACKSVIRKAQDLYAASPGASNRYSLLAVIFQGQKRLLSLETTEQNRSAVFDTCSELLKAPDEYAELRLEADMLLQERDHALNNATVAVRTKALEALVARYRGTRAEWKSLTIASLIAPKLLAFELEQKFRDMMSERFGGNHEVIAFRRNDIGVDNIDAVFSGTYKIADGSSLTFPYDRMGHQSLMVFWSAKADGYAEFLGRVKEQQERFPGRFEVYSFNTDELPDAGGNILRTMGLNWTAVHLPEGKTSSAYLAYAKMDPVALLVNGQGHVHLERGQSVPWPAPTPARGKKSATQGPGIGIWLDSDRYLSQLRYLFIGEFLVAEPDIKSGGTIPDETLRAIQSCFVPPPFYYRLSRDEALANYKKAEKLCADAIKKNTKSPDLWLVRNRRIIALLGTWNLAREPKHLEEAVKEARATLAMQLPAGADMVSRFCLAKEALRKGGADPEKILAGIVEETGGVKAPATAIAAAAILGIEANAITPYGEYRVRLLGLDDDANPTLWPVLSFMRDRLHTFRLFWGNPGRYSDPRLEKYKFRQWVSGVADAEFTGRVFKAEFKKLDSGLLSFPAATDGKMTGIIFADPSGDDASRSNLAERVSEIADEYVSRDIKVVVAFLSGDTNVVASLSKQIEPAFQPAMVPDGLRNPLVLRLGLLSADLCPNQILLRPDGTIAWMTSGLTYTVSSGIKYAISLAVGINIIKVGTDAAFEALEKGDFKKALLLFEERVTQKKQKDWWAADRLQGRALAHMGLKDWNAALAEIDAAIEQRLNDFGGSNPCRCHGAAEMRLAKAIILDRLGKKKEAEAERRLAAAPANPHPFYPVGIERDGVPIGVYYDRLQKIRLALFEAGVKK